MDQEKGDVIKLSFEKVCELADTAASDAIELYEDSARFRVVRDSQDDGAHEVSIEIVDHTSESTGYKPFQVFRYNDDGRLIGIWALEGLLETGVNTVCFIDETKEELSVGSKRVRAIGSSTRTCTVGKERQEMIETTYLDDGTEINIVSEPTSGDGEITFSTNRIYLFNGLGSHDRNGLSESDFNKVLHNGRDIPLAGLFEEVCNPFSLPMGERKVRIPDWVTVAKLEHPETYVSDAHNIHIFFSREHGTKDMILIDGVAYPRQEGLVYNNWLALLALRCKGESVSRAFDIEIMRDNAEIRIVNDLPVLRTEVRVDEVSYIFEFSIDGIDYDFGFVDTIYTDGRDVLKSDMALPVVTLNFTQMYKELLKLGHYDRSILYRALKIHCAEEIPQLFPEEQ